MNTPAPTTGTTLNYRKLTATMAEILGEATIEGLTAEGIFARILKEKNAVSSYFETHGIKEQLILDFQTESLKPKDEVYIEKISSDINYIFNNASDRYVGEFSFIMGIQRAPNIKTLFDNIIGKYLNPIYVFQDFEKITSAVPNEQWSPKPTSILSIVGKDLTQMAKNKELPVIVGRNEEIFRMVNVLTRQTKSNPMILGEAGVGKTALVEKLAGVMLNYEEIPDGLHGYKIVELNMPQVFSALGMDEEIVQRIVDAAIKEKTILFIDEVHVIMRDDGKIANILKPAMARGELKIIGATTEDEFKVFEKDEAIQRRFQPIKVNEPSGVSVFEILKIKAKTNGEYHNVIIPQKSLLKAIVLSEQYMQHRKQPDKAIDLIEEASARVRLNLDSKPKSISVIEEKIAQEDLKIEMIMAKHDGVDSNLSEIDNKKKKICVEKIKGYAAEFDELNQKYEPQKKLLDALFNAKEKFRKLQKEKEEALHLGNFTEVAEKDSVEIPNQEKIVQRLEDRMLELAEYVEENMIQNVVTPNMVALIIEEQTGIPVAAQGEEDLQKYKDIENTLKKEIFGQDKAVEEISTAIKRSKLGLADKNKPLGSFLCLGPTGVGKTYLAQKLAEFMFQTAKVLKRFDMSEYMESHSVARLFGSPPGYVGHEAGGQLTETVRRNPYSILLFDEIEKAHPKVFDALLQILDAGRMVDGKGNIVNFKNTVIILTSNIGTDIIKAGLESDYPDTVVETAINQEIKKHFRPEFLNRFDAKIVFKSLDKPSVIKIAELELNRLRDMIEESNGLQLYWAKEVPTVITDIAYDITDGARPIKRFINDNVVSLITDKIFSGDIVKDSKIFLAVDGEGFDIFMVDDIALKELTNWQKAPKEQSAAKKSTKTPKKKKKIKNKGGE